MKNLILIAPPGAGKGTQSKLLCSKLDMVHISIGDLLRNKMSELSDDIKDDIKLGKLISDNIIVELLKEKINCINKGFILDGFPRNINQAKMLDNLGIKIDFVINLDVPKEYLLNRILGRLVCLECGHVYNELIEKSKPQTPFVCDNCNSELIKRYDDTIEVFNARYDTYLNETKPILEFYRNKDILYNINSLDKEEIFNEILNILGNDL